MSPFQARRSPMRRVREGETAFAADANAMSKSLPMMKARQARKIRELRDALSASGLRTIAQQSRALNVPRSTAWTIQRAAHKGSGLSAATISRMLASSQLPPPARTKVLEYVAEKTAGHYGHVQKDRYKFSSQISKELLSGIWRNSLTSEEANTETSYTAGTKAAGRG